MGKVATNITIDEEVKRKSQVLLKEFGLDLSSAVNMFLRQMLREKAIPFEIKGETFNDTTLAAIKEVEEMEKHPENVKTYRNTNKLVKDLKN